MKNKIIFKRFLISLLIVLLLTSINISVSSMNSDDKTKNLDTPSNSNEYNWQLYPYDLSYEKGLGSNFEPIKEGEKLPLTLYPPTWDWRNNGIMTSVKNQGGCGSCVAFGTLSSFEAVIKLKSGQNLDLSEADLFFCGCGECCNIGWYVSSSVNYLYNNGVPDEACFPYHAYNQDCNTCEDRINRIEKPSDYGYVASASNIKSAIFTYGPVITSFTVYDDFYEYTGGIYYHTHGNVRGGHCVSVVGYNDDVGYWICKNSWGSNWGENGYFRIGYGEAGICGYAYYLDYDSPYLSVDIGGPYSGSTRESINFLGSAIGGNPPYEWYWDFGDGNNSDIQNPTHAYSEPGTYAVTLTVTDNEDQTSQDETTAEITNAPYIPYKPSGPTIGYINTPYTYSTVTTDPNNANIRYGWDWDGNGMAEEWTGYYPSGTPIELSHSFNSPGEYNVRVKAKNTLGIKSELSQPLKVIISESNQPPYQPTNPNPEDNSENIPLNIELNWECSDPDLGDSITYDVYFGKTNPPPKVIDKQSTEIYYPGKLKPATTYYWRINAWDSLQNFVEGTIWKFTTEGQPNNPPTKPQINGPNTGKTGSTYQYTFVSTDLDADSLYYYIDWGDDTITDWIGPYNTGEEVGLTHTWNNKGTYTIQAKSRDLYEESDWSSMEVSVSKNKRLTDIFSLNFFKELIDFFLNQIIFKI